MAKLEPATWCRPCIEGDSITFRHAYKLDGKWYDIQVLQKEGDRVIGPASTYMEARLIQIQQIALEKIFPHLPAPTTQIVKYADGKCSVDSSPAGEAILEGMQEIDEALHGEMGGVSLTGRSLLFHLKSFKRPCLERPPAQAAEVDHSLHVLSDADFIGAIDRAAARDRFDSAIGYAQFEQDARGKPDTSIYNAYIKVLKDPISSEVDAVRMRKWLESLHDAAINYLKDHPLFPGTDHKEQAAKILINYISAGIQTKQLIDYLHYR